MSAFLVDNETINKIVTHLNFSMADGVCLRGEIHERIGADPNTPEGAQKLGRMLLRANVEALKARYGDNEISTLFAYRFIPVPSCTKIEALKAAKCLRYQCSEGDVSESDTYKLLELIINSWSSAIINALPEYDRAEWG